MKYHVIKNKIDTTRMEKNEIFVKTKSNLKINFSKPYKIKKIEKI